MPGCGTRTFAQPEHYEAALGQGLTEAVITPCGKFQARLTWVELHNMQLLRCEEDFPRIGYFSLAPQLAVLAFPISSSRFPVWGGITLHAENIMLHSRGGRLHQATSAASAWGLIAIDPGQLENYGRALVKNPMSPPPEARVLQPSRRDGARLRRLHRQACRLAETNPKILAHPEVARAIEQGLIHALVTCLATAKVESNGGAKRQHARIMVRFEEVLAEHLSRPLHMPELCERIGVTERTLRSCCGEFLGVTVSRYVLLRRLKQVRAALRDADPDTANVAELARNGGFTELGRFAGVYQAIFGETPSATLRRAPSARFAGP